MIKIDSPFELLATAAHEVAGREINCEVKFVDMQENWEDGAFTNEFDSDCPIILIHYALPLHLIIEALAHELAHIIVGDRGHKNCMFAIKQLNDAFNRLSKEKYADETAAIMEAPHDA